MVGYFYLFKLGGVDLIIGVAQLETLGEIKVNWRTLSMSFVHQDQNMVIKEILVY